MAQSFQTRRGRYGRRRAVATLEFVMALPLLFVLMLLILYVGFWMIAKSELLIDARNQAWKERFQDAAKEPLVFPVPGQSLLYDQNKDFVTKTTARKIEVSPALDAIPGPQASHWILVGSWDHKAMPFERPPELELMAKAAAIGWGGQVFDWMSQIDNPVGLLKTLGANAAREAANAPATVAQGGASGSGSGSGGGSGGGAGSVPASNTAQEGEELTKERRDAKIRELKTQYKKLGGKQDPFRPGDDTVIPAGGDLKALDDEIDRLEEDLAEKERAADIEPDEEKKEPLDKEIDQLNRKIELTQVKYKRIETEFLDVVAELEALDINRWDLYRE